MSFADSGCILKKVVEYVIIVTGIEEMFLYYTQTVDTAIVYKLGKTLVEWLDNWKYN